MLTASGRSSTQLSGLWQADERGHRDDGLDRASAISATAREADEALLGVDQEATELAVHVRCGGCGKCEVCTRRLCSTSMVINACNRDLRAPARLYLTLVA